MSTSYQLQEVNDYGGAPIRPEHYPTMMEAIDAAKATLEDATPALAHIVIRKASPSGVAICIVRKRQEAHA